MKYLITVAAMLMLSVGQSIGQMATSVDVLDVPKKVLTAFSKNGNVENVDWSYQNQQYIASFYNENQLVFLQLYYDLEGKWIKTAKELNETALPADIALSLNELYGEDYAIFFIVEETHAVSKKVEYVVEIENLEEMLLLRFDKNGALLSKKMIAQELEIIDEDEDD